MARSISKSALAVAREAYEVGQAALAAYSCKYSRKDFTQAQLFALLVLRQFFKVDYRGVMQWAQEWSDLREVLELQKVPHWTCLQKAEARLLKKGLSSICSAESSIEPLNVA